MASSSSSAAPDILGKEAMGRRLRAERKARKMTLQTLSAASGIAVSTLSKAELGQIALSYEKFASLARALDIDMTRLFRRGDGEPPAATPTYVKGRLDDSLDYVTDNYHYRLLLGDYPDKKMTPMLGIIESRSVDEFEEYVRHPGQEFVIVLSGKVRIQFENGESVVLSRFESAYFSSGIGHVYLSMSARPAHVLAVCTDLDTFPAAPPRGGARWKRKDG
ncbi:transcriptional regulator [Bordetella ansorpii]|uniref:Transcriptional regulator n=1 Tax=Bordetella ansorpii TaxID=288768 RepID=A0A157SL58_9BORD|nr:XRE family transcriptional regulator [Bordetella ansorpii]SAI71034.1 transcriptional regulator [Bordetella ansorpii]